MDSSITTGILILLKKIMKNITLLKPKRSHSETIITLIVDLSAQHSTFPDLV
jgi:hypothetical protein